MVRPPLYPPARPQSTDEVPDAPGARDAVWWALYDVGLVLTLSRAPGTPDAAAAQAACDPTVECR